MNLQQLCLYINTITLD